MSPATDAGADAQPDGRIGQCGPTLKPYGPACVPILDDCPGDQVSIPGGGCKRIGVEECELEGQTGLRGPPDWTCQPIGAPRTLPCGESR
jgi:hypothetical protein